MYNKNELSSKGIQELSDIAQKLGAEINEDNMPEEIVYSILDKQVMPETDKNATGTKRRRTRIPVRETDRMYLVNGKEGENSDLKKEKPASEPTSLFKEDNVNKDDTSAQEEQELAPGEELAAIPEHRGGKTKRELELLAMIDARKEENQEGTEEQEIEAEGNDDTEASRSNEARDEVYEKNSENAEEEASETGVENTSHKDPGTSNLLEHLQAKVNAHNENEQERREAIVKGIWGGDLADGTDFIVVQDLSVVDQGAVPSYDMLGNPTTPVMPSASYQTSVNTNASDQPAHDFSDIIEANGVLEIMSGGYGFLRSSDYNYLSPPDDVYVASSQIKKYGLKTGGVMRCHVRPPHGGGKHFPLTNIDEISGENPNEVRDRAQSEHLTLLFPEEKFTLCGDKATINLSTRVVDLFSPIDKGQHTLIVAQPKTGKAILMKDIADAIAANHPEAYLMMLLIDERPEEMTDMARTVNAEVIASTFDESAERHVRIAGVVLEKTKRMVECGHDMVIFLDSITRLARAYNIVGPASGKVLTDGADASALQKPKWFFGVARNIEGGGSLTIIATALIDTGSKMDEVIFEEFKGTGNMELQLDRLLSNKCVFPTINLIASSTRHDGLLQDKTTLDRMWILRRYIAGMNPIEAMNSIHDRMIRTHNNNGSLVSMSSW